MAEIINILPLNPNNFEFQEYSSSDLNLIVSTEIETSFDTTSDYIEYYVYDLSGNILVSNIFGFPGYKLINNQVSIDPVADLAAYGYEQGSYNTLYNFLKRKLGSTPLSTYYIDEISSDRTEIRLNTTEIPNIDVVALTNDFINEIQNSPVGYVDFYLDFGDNQLIIANNILLDDTTPDDPTILIKLYEPLPSQFNLKTPCWVVQQIANSLAYNISITSTFDTIGDNIYINRPNFNLSVSDNINNSTDYINYTTLTSPTSSYSQGTGSLQYQLNNLLAQRGLSINIDYSEYNNFIHFGSAQSQLENFYYKLQLLENYTYSASFSNNSSSGSYYVSSSNIVWQSKINEIITTFDPYEYYLYYSSGSTAWPKTGNTPPYTNYPTTSTSGSQWFVSQSLVAEQYDLENNNALTLAIPSYILEDSDNYNFELFVEMIGQSFDSVFVYLQDVTNKYNADNRLNYGVSKDLVADILRDMGIKIYQNNFSSNDLYQALIGLTPSGSLYNLPFTTTQFPVPTGSFLEYITTYVTASSTSSLYPTNDINKEQYKRIYHNLPLLLKKKGSVAGIRDLITTFGVDDTILRINEFGGKDRNPNSYDNWQDEFNYAFYTSGSSFISSSFTLNSTWGAPSNKPQSVEFRFQTTNLPTSSGYYSQSLWSTNTGVNIRLRYTGSGYTTSSLISSSADPVNPYYQYALLDFIPDASTPSTSASIYLPFYDGGWWSVLLNKSQTTSHAYQLFAKDKNYDGEDGNVIGFQASASITASNSNTWTGSTISYFGTSSLSGKIFSGSFQEIRYYTLPLSESNFDAYVMNPYSIESSENLAFRATLGGELYTASISVHPKVTGSWVATSSFASNSIFSTSSGGKYIPNTEVFYFDQVPAGIQNAISQKIKQQNIVLPYSSSDSNIPNANVLSPFISIQQFPTISSSYTRDIDYVELGFSPQNEINEDINSQLGYFNLGDVIGDPRFQSSSLDTYPALDAIRESYFQKYVSNYQEWDYVRLIEFFDNSLFKMFADFVPARTSLASGIIIKQTLLERNRYRTPQVSPSASIALIGSGSSSVGIPYTVEDQLITGSIAVGSTVGTNGGSLPDDYYLALNPSNYNIPFSSSVTYQLSQSGVYNVIFNISSSGGSGATLKVYNSSAVPSSFSGRATSSVFTISSGSGLNTTANFIADFSTQYITIFNDNDTGSAQTESISNIKMYHLPAYKSSTPSLSGSVTQILTNYYDFNGELEGTNLVVTNGDLSNPTVITPQVFSQTPIPVAYTFPANFFASGVDYGFPRVTQSYSNYVTYDFDIDKYYYLSFTASITGSIPSGGYDLVIVNSDDTFAKDVSSGSYDNAINLSSATTIIQDYQITGLKPLIYFLNIDGGSSVVPINLYNFVVKESELLDPEGYVVENDVQLERLNSKYMDIDFSTNPNIAVNSQDILSGSATKAAVQNSNYTSAKQINPRYIGCKLISPTGSRYEGFVNQQMTTGSSIGALANVEQYGDWFAYFDNISAVDYSFITNSGSALRTGSAVHITTLIDVFGNKIDLSPTNNILITGSELATTASLTVSSASLAPLTLGISGSFVVNGITIKTTGSIQANTATQINVLTGSNFANTLISVSTAFNFSSSVSPYSSSLQYISSSVTANTISFFTTASLIGTIFSANTLNAYTFVSGSTTTNFSGATNQLSPNPLISNIPLVNSIFPYNLMDESGLSSENTPVSIRQYIISGSTNVTSGSFSNYNVVISGIQPLYNAELYDNVYGIPNETIVVLKQTGSQVSPLTNIPGLLIPGNFNPKYKDSLLSIAQTAGLFKTI
jgi:hypothetical protein